MGPLIEIIYRSFSVVLIVLFCVVVLKGLSGWFAKDKNGVADFPYFKKTYFFTPTEKKFFDVLVEAVGDEVAVFAQVELPLFCFGAQNEYSVADIRKGLGIKA
jgi:hypothetical protein